MVNKVKNAKGTVEVSILLLFSFSCHSNFTYVIRQIYGVAILHFYSIFPLEFSPLQSVTKFYKGYFPHLKHT